MSIFTKNEDKDIIREKLVYNVTKGSTRLNSVYKGSTILFNNVEIVSTLLGSIVGTPSAIGGLVEASDGRVNITSGGDRSNTNVLGLSGFYTTSSGGTLNSITTGTGTGYQEPCIIDGQLYYTDTGSLGYCYMYSTSAGSLVQDAVIKPSMSQIFKFSLTGGSTNTWGSDNILLARKDSSTIYGIVYNTNASNLSTGALPCKYMCFTMNTTNNSFSFGSTITVGTYPNSRILPQYGLICVLSFSSKISKPLAVFQHYKTTDPSGCITDICTMNGTTLSSSIYSFDENTTTSSPNSQCYRLGLGENSNCYNFNESDGYFVLANTYTVADESKRIMVLKVNSDATEITTVYSGSTIFNLNDNNMSTSSGYVQGQVYFNHYVLYVLSGKVYLGNFETLKYIEIPIDEFGGYHDDTLFLYNILNDKIIYRNDGYLYSIDFNKFKQKYCL